MTRDDIIRMAREAGLTEDMFSLREVFVWEAEPKDLERFAALVAAAEREACAKVCEEYETTRQDNYACLCVEAIRKRGEVKP